jgi:hypothetical protein
MKDVRGRPQGGRPLTPSSQAARPPELFVLETPPLFAGGHQFSSGFRRVPAERRRGAPRRRNPPSEAGFGSTERRRSRTYPPTGYAGSPVLKLRQDRSISVRKRGFRPASVRSGALRCAETGTNSSTKFGCGCLRVSPPATDTVPTRQLDPRLEVAVDQLSIPSRPDPLTESMTVMRRIFQDHRWTR